MKNKEKILELLKEDLEDCYSYHQQSIINMLDYYSSIKERKEKGSFWWLCTYKEDIEMETMNRVSNTIENRLIKDKEDYLSYTKLKPTNAHEESLINVIGMLRHIVRCYNPS